MVGNLLRGFELAAILRISGDARRAKGVIPNFRFNAGGEGAALVHPVHACRTERIQ